VRWFILFVIVLIVASLFSGLFFLVKDRGETDRTVRALTVRIGLSVALVAILGVCFYLGILPLKN
jgi:hypothetical protein